MSRTIRILPLAIVALLLLIVVIVLIVPSGSHGAPDIDHTAADWKTPAEIKWVRNAAGTNESVVLFGDPSKAGQVWGMGPATSTPAEKR
jgi:peptidoglycan/LPS O-acetylase OafA/YrhL